MTFLAIALAIALGAALFKLWQHRRALRALEQAVLQRQQFLREEDTGLGPTWDRLCDAINAMGSELNRLQQFRSSQVAQLEATLGSLQEAVLIVDENNHILLANNALQGIFPNATKNILGRRLELVLHSREFLEYVDSVRGGHAQAQYPIEFAEGSHSIWTEVTGALITPLDGQEHPWALFVLHDITRQRKLESVRKEFVANVSHELRTPLSVIKGYIETLVDDHQEMPLDDRDRFLKTIQRHTERLNSLLEDLLTLSRLESINPGLTRESVDLASLITSLIEDYRSRPAAASHQLRTTVDPEIDKLLIDPLKITQILENLLDNALKYTPAGSSIDVTAKRQEGETIVCVRDNGPGIPAEDLPHIFERFYRVDKGRSREKGGTGLGLSIVKHIAQLHGGRAWAESQIGQGTSMHFSLPHRERA